MSIEEVTARSSHRESRPPPSIPTNVLDQFLLPSRVAIITGAADGIGLAVAEAYAEAGAHLALWYNTNSAAITHAQTLAKRHSITAKAYKVNVSSADQVEKTIAQVLQDFGRVDIMVANAGMAISKPLLETSLDEYHAQMRVNVDGVVYCAKYAGAVFKSQGSGNLIITSSISAHIVNVPVDQPVYNATKACVTHLGKSLAREWREFARVNIVSPGFFDTKMGMSDTVRNEGLRMTVLGRQGDTKEIKGLFLYLASDASSYVTGADFVIDGGYILP